MSTFGTAQQESLKTNLRSTLGCEEPVCILTLRVSTGSINVAAILTIPDTPTSGVGGAANATATAAAVASAATALVAQPASAISSVLAVAVESAAPTVSVGHAITPIVVAPPPPSPPPVPEPPPPPSPPTPRDLLPAEQDGQTAEGGTGLTEGALIGIIGGACALIVLVIVVVAAKFCFGKKPVKDVKVEAPTAADASSSSASSVEMTQHAFSQNGARANNGVASERSEKEDLETTERL